MSQANSSELGGDDAAHPAARKQLRRSLEERIADAAALLKGLEDEKRKRDSAAKAVNEKALRKLLAEEKLLSVDIAAWREALPAIRKALGLDGKA